MLGNQSRIKHDSKLRLINMLYLKKSNCILQDNQYGDKARYLITLNSQANLENSLAKICQLFTDTIYQVKGDHQSMQNRQQEFRFNLIFQFMVKLYFLEGSILPNTDKETEVALVSQSQIIKNLAYNFRTNEQIKQDFRVFSENCKKYIQEQLRRQSKDEQIFIKLRNVRRRLVQKCKESILVINLDNQQNIKRRRIYIPVEMQGNPELFISKTISTIAELRFTKKKYRILKFQNYLNNYRHFFQTKIQRFSQQPTQIVTNFTIRRYSNLNINDKKSPDQMLITIENLIRIRRIDSINDGENIEMVRMLGNQLLRHKKSTDCHYPILSPKYVLFNQLSLQTQLSYYPPILEGLGFLKRPCSIEQLITFKGTPEPFDPFAAPNELLFDNQQAEIGDEIFYNYLYGIDSLLQKDQQIKKLKGRNLKLLQFNGKTMSKIKQQYQSYSQMWRYIMISSYILNNKVFSQEYVSNLNTFKPFLKKQAQLIQKDKVKFIQTVMGRKFTQNLQRNKHESLRNQEKFRMSIFNNFIGQKDQFFDENVQIQQKKQFILDKYGIISIITQILKKDQKQKDINIDKYISLIILFYLYSFQYLTNIKLILNSALKNILEVNKLLTNTEICKILSFNDKDKLQGLISGLQKSWNTLSVVKEKSKDKKHRLYSLYQTYKQIFSRIDQIRKKCRLCHQRMRKQYLQGFTLQNQGSYEKILAEINPTIVLCLRYALQICQKQISWKKTYFNSQQVDSYIISLSLNLKIKYFLLSTTQNSIKLSSVHDNLYLDINSQNKQRTVELLEYCLSILRQQQKNIAQLKEEYVIV